MFESFKFVSSQRTRAVEISKSVFDFVESFFLHDDEIMRNELTYDTEILSKFRQKRRRRNKNDEKTSIRRRQIKQNVDVIEKLIQLQKKKTLLKQRIKLRKFRKKINLLRFSVSKTNEFDFLITTIKNSAIDTKSYMSKVIRLFVVKTSTIDKSSVKKRTMKFKNTEIYHDKIVKKYLNYVRSVNTTFRMIFENFQTHEQKIVYAMQFLKNEFKNA